MSSSWVGIFEILIMGLCGFILIKKEILPKKTSKVISKLIMELTLPFMIFSKIVTQFQFDKFEFWWLLPLVAIGMIFVGFILGKIFSITTRANIKREFISLCAYQNSGYLPLALIGSMFVGNKADIFFIYVFLFLAGFNFIIWSMGTFYLKKSVPDMTLKWSSFFTPPFIAILISLGLVATGLNKFIPEIILNPVSKIGSSTVPLGIIAIGAILGEVKFQLREEIGSFIKIVFIKLITLPVLTIVVLQFVKLPEWIEFFIFMESLMPSATSLGVIARRYHAEYRYIANGVFLTHLCSLVTIPAFVALYHKLLI